MIIQSDLNQLNLIVYFNRRCSTKDKNFQPCATEHKGITQKSVSLPWEPTLVIKPSFVLFIFLIKVLPLEKKHLYIPNSWIFKATNQLNIHIDFLEVFDRLF